MSKSKSPEHDHRALIRSEILGRVTLGHCAHGLTESESWLAWEREAVKVLRERGYNVTQKAKP